MWHPLKVYLCTLPVVFALDFLWIGFLASGLYRADLGGFLRLGADGSLKPIVWAALLVYLAIPAGIVCFVLPRVSAGNWLASSLGWGALFGGLVYAIYDFTNYSLFARWPLRVTLVDVCWGGVLCGIATVAASALSRWL